MYTLGYFVLETDDYNIHKKGASKLLTSLYPWNAVIKECTTFVVCMRVPVQPTQKNREIFLNKANGYYIGTYIVTILLHTMSLHCYIHCHCIVTYSVTILYCYIHCHYLVTYIVTILLRTVSLSCYIHCHYLVTYIVAILARLSG